MSGGVQVCNFMEKYGNLQLFPVKIQVPLIMSLRATLHVKNIQLWDAGQPSTSRRGLAAVASGGSTGPISSPPGLEFWEPPVGYKHVSFDELDAAHLAKRSAAKRAAREKRETARRERRKTVTGSISRHGGTSSDVAESAPM